MLEYVDGETLKEIIRREGPLEIPQAIAYAIEIARALGAAHERQIVHRDVKPHNILISEEGGAKITDFGIARTLTEEGLTIAGRVLGTTDYVSPEQALGQRRHGAVGPVFAGDRAVRDAHGLSPVPRQLAGGGGDEARPRGSARRAAAATGAVGSDGGGRRSCRLEGPRAPLSGRGGMVADLEEVLALEASRYGQMHRRGHERAAHASGVRPRATAVAHAPPGAVGGVVRPGRGDHRDRADHRRRAATHRGAGSPDVDVARRPGSGAARPGCRAELQPLRHRP